MCDSYVLRFYNKNTLALICQVINRNNISYRKMEIVWPQFYMFVEFFSYIRYFIHNYLLFFCFT